jgi:hypothetical protein
MSYHSLLSQSRILKALMNAHLAYLFNRAYVFRDYLLTVLPDYFANDPSAPDKDATFLGHCRPDIDQIVAKVRLAQSGFAKADGLDAVYIATPLGLRIDRTMRRRAVCGSSWVV